MLCITSDANSNDATQYAQPPITMTSIVHATSVVDASAKVVQINDSASTAVTGCGCDNLVTWSSQVTPTTLVKQAC